MILQVPCIESEEGMLMSDVLAVGFVSGRQLREQVDCKLIRLATLCTIRSTVSSHYNSWNRNENHAQMVS